MAESWLPGSSWVSSLRIDTGTDATSDLSGRSSWAISHLRIDPAQAASTTSFTVVPYTRLTSLKSSSEALPKAMERWGVMAPLKLVRGAVKGSVADGPSLRRTTRSSSSAERPVRARVGNTWGQ